MVIYNNFFNKKGNLKLKVFSWTVYYGRYDIHMILQNSHENTCAGVFFNEVVYSIKGFRYSCLPMKF